MDNKEAIDTFLATGSFNKPTNERSSPAELVDHTFVPVYGMDFGELCTEADDQLICSEELNGVHEDGAIYSYEHEALDSVARLIIKGYGGGPDYCSTRSELDWGAMMVALGQYGPEPLSLCQGPVLDLEQRQNLYATLVQGWIHYRGLVSNQRRKAPRSVHSKEVCHCKETPVDVPELG